MRSVLNLHAKTAVGKLDNMENRDLPILARSSYHFACFTTGGISVLIDMNMAQYATKSIVELRTALFWVVKQVAAFPYRCFGTTYQSYHLETFYFVSWPLKMGPNRRYGITTTRCVMTQKNAVLEHLLRGGNLKSRLLNFYRRLEADVLVVLYTGLKRQGPP